MLDPRLRLPGCDELHEVTTFECQKPGLVHETAAVEIAAAENRRDLRSDQIIVLGDVAARAHVYDVRLYGRDRVPAGNRDRLLRQRRPIACLVQRTNLRLRDVKKLVTIRHDDVGGPQIAELTCMLRTAADFRHRDSPDISLNEMAAVAAFRFRRGPHREFLASATGR